MPKEGDGLSGIARRIGRSVAPGQRAKKARGMSSGRNMNARRRAFRDRRRRSQRMSGQQ